MAGDHLAQTAEAAIGTTCAVIAADLFLKAVIAVREEGRKASEIQL